MKNKEERLIRISTAFKKLTDQGIKLRHVTRPELKISIKMMIDGGARKHGKRFFRPALDTMVILLAERQHIKTSLRTLSRAIKELVEERDIWRLNRHTRGKGIKMVCRATAYYLWDKGKEIFRKMLRQAQRVLLPLGVPKVASDNNTLKSVFTRLATRNDSQGTFNPLKEVASLH